MNTVEIQKIPNIANFVGRIPDGAELVEYERGSDPVDDGLVLYGFDEIGTLGQRDPQYAFVKFL